MKYLIALIVLIASNSSAQTSDCEGLECIVNKISQTVETISTPAVEKLSQYCLRDNQIPACLSVGKFYDFKNQEVKGEEFYLKACKMRSAQGCLLGGYNLERQGKESRSNDLYTMGCYQTEAGGQNCIALAQNYREQRNWAEALKHYELACEKNEGQGCFFAQEIYNYVKHTPGKWKFFLSKGCNLGHTGSCYKLAYYAQSYGEKVLARWGYQQACVKEVMEACEEFRIINEGGIVEKWWQKNRLKIQDTKDRVLYFIEQAFPIGPQK